MFLRVIGRPLMAKMKQTTEIVGLDVGEQTTGVAIANAREVLINLYKNTLKHAQTFPADEPSRVATEVLIKPRLKVCEEEEEVKMIEKRLCYCMIEDLIEEAEFYSSMFERASAFRLEWKKLRSDRANLSGKEFHKALQDSIKKIARPKEFQNELKAFTDNDAPAVTSGESQQKE